MAEGTTRPRDVEDANANNETISDSFREEEEVNADDADHDDDDANDDANGGSGGGGLSAAITALRDRGPGGGGPQLAALLCFVVLHNFKPSEPFLVEMYEAHGVSAHEVFTRIFPVWTYARLPSLAAVALGVHLVGCKPVVGAVQVEFQFDPVSK